MEGFILEIMSIEGLPTDLGTLRSTPAGLLCSGRQDKMVIVSLFLLLFMVRCEARRAEEVPLGCGGDLEEPAPRPPQQARYQGRNSLDACPGRA